MAAAAGGSGALILAEVGPPNKSIFVPADKRLQLERLSGCRAGLGEGGGGRRAPDCRCSDTLSGGLCSEKEKRREAANEVRE